MRNTVACSNCGSENPIYKLNCTSCNSILRNRVVNIDFWKTVWGIIESPISTFRNIIQAEHKNFLIMLAILAGLNFSMDSLTFVNLFKIRGSSTNIWSHLTLGILSFNIILLIIAFLLKYILRSVSVNSRFKDNYSILIYSQIPQLVLFPIFVIIEFALFGDYWLSFNPPPYLMKPGIAYVLFGLEGIFLLLSMGLTIIGLYTQTRLKLFSLVSGIIISSLILFTMYYNWL